MAKYTNEQMAKVLCPCGYTFGDAEFAAHHSMTGRCTGPAERAVDLRSTGRGSLVLAHKVAEVAYEAAPAGSHAEALAALSAAAAAEALEAFDLEIAEAVESARQDDIAAEQARQDVQQD